MSSEREQRLWLLEQVTVDLMGIDMSLAAGDASTAKWSAGRARDAVARLKGLDAEKPRAQRPPRTSSRRRPRASSNGTRTRRQPLAQRRNQILELLHRESEPLSADEISKKLGVSRTVVTRATESIDGDLLEVVKGRGSNPTKYALASLRDQGS